MRLQVFNFSDVYGGQEAYLCALLGWLQERSAVHSLTFVGGPPALKHLLPAVGVTAVDARTEQGAEVWLFNGNRALYRQALCRRGRVVRVYVQHSSIDDRQAGLLKPLIRRLLLRLLLTRVDAVIRVSKACLPDKFAPGKIHTVPNGVDVTRFPCRLHWRDASDPGPLKLLMVGALTENKNQRMAICLLVSCPSATLTLLGDGPERMSLQAEAQQLGVAHRVRWMGVQADPSPFYREADLCLLLSRHEAAPFVLLEAMASGTPVVATAVGGIPEVLTDGVNGRLLPAATVESLREVVSSFMQEPASFRRLGSAARQTVERQYTVQHMSAGFMNVVRAAMASRTPGSHP